MKGREGMVAYIVFFTTSAILYFHLCPWRVENRGIGGLAGYGSELNHLRNVVEMRADETPEGINEFQRLTSEFVGWFNDSESIELGFSFLDGATLTEVSPSGLVDPWGDVINVEVVDGRVTIWSNGPNRRDDRRSGDDIVAKAWRGE